MVATPDFERRIEISLALRSYLREVRRWQNVTDELATAMQALAAALPQPCRYVVRLDLDYFLVTRPDQGPISLEPIECL